MPSHTMCPTPVRVNASMAVSDAVIITAMPAATIHVAVICPPSTPLTAQRICGLPEIPEAMMYAQSTPGSVLAILKPTKSCDQRPGHPLRPRACIPIDWRCPVRHTAKNISSVARRAHRHTIELSQQQCSSRPGRLYFRSRHAGRVLADAGY